MNGWRWILAAAHAYVALRLLPAVAQSVGWPGTTALAAWLLASLTLMPLGLRRSRGARSLPEQRRDDRNAWIGLGLMGLFSSLFVLTVLRDALLLGVGLVELATGHATDPRWVVDSAVLVPLLALAITAVGLRNARRPAQVKTVDVPLRGLAAGLQGFRIVQISDLHVGPTIKGDWLARVVDAVNALEPDVVAVTGDLVDGSVADLAVHVAPLAKLRARHGTFFVTGNHEYYAGAEPWIAELRRLGITVLMNEHVVLTREADDRGGGDARLVLAGVADFSAHHFEPTHRSDPHRAIAGAPADAVKILLAHQPRSAAAAADAGFHLQLSGHTHGGQFLPWNFFVRLQQPFTAGLHALRDLWVYTSRGTGYWGPPKRFGAPSEITELRLVAA